MKLSVKVKANSKIAGVEKISEKEYLLRVKAPAKEGRANEAAVKLLSDYFGISKSRILITRGRAARNKVIEIIS